MKSFFNRLRHACVSLFPFFVVCLIIVNLIVAFYVFRSSHPRYMYRTFEVTNVVCSVTTTFVGAVSSPLVENISTNSESSASRVEPSTINKSYDYFVLSSLRMARIDGITYSEGDVCSRGLILRIFPDRIYLHNGDVIENNSSRRGDSRRTKEFAKK